MDRVAHLPAAERSALFAETAARMRTTPAVAEKDFWVTWVLDRLFGDAELARLLMFKGGTSLSKAYRLIDRFSEDTRQQQGNRGQTTNDAVQPAPAF